ncbi:MAG: flippase [Patescibacteria group bacterium]
MSLTGQLSRNTILQIAGKVVSTVIGLMVIGLLTRSLGTDRFGHYTTALAFVQVFGVLVDMGLYIVLVKKLAEEPDRRDAWASTAFTLRLYTALGFLVLAPLTVLFTNYPGDVKTAVAIATLATFAVTMNQVLVGVFQWSLRMDRVAIAEIIGRVVLLSGTLVAVANKTSVTGVMITVALGSLVNAAVSFWFSRSFVRIRLHLEREMVRTIFREGWPVALSIAFNLVYFKADTLILSAVRPASEVGLYGSAYKVLEVLATIPAMVAGLLMPLLAAAYARQEQDRLRDILQRAVDTVSLLAIPLAIGTGFVAQQVMLLVGGPDYVGAANALTLLMIATAAIFYGNLFANTVVAINAQRRMLWGYAGVAVASLAGYLLTIPRWGMAGAATMTVVSEVGVTLVALYFIYRATRVRLRPTHMLKVVGACIPLVIALALTPNLALVWRLGLAVLAYAIGLTLFRIFPVDLLRQTFSRFSYARRD